MPHRDRGQGATPGVTPPPLTRHPLGTRGELTPGPDDLDPDVPEERRELERLGYNVEPVDELADLGVMNDAFDDPEPARLFDAPPAVAAALPTLTDGPLFD
jgi:hypothetical protein